MTDEIQPAPKRVAIYARVSTRKIRHNADGAEQVAQNPETQLKPLREYASMRGWTVIEEFVDRGISGMLESRPALDMLMEGARDHRFDVILVWRFDRFGRSTAHLIKSLLLFRDMGLDFVASQDGVDTSTHTGKMVFGLLAVLAEFEHDLISERVTAGMARAKAEGKRLGRKPKEIDLRPALAMLQNGSPIEEVVEMLGISRRTLLRRLEIEEEKKTCQ